MKQISVALLAAAFLTALCACTKEPVVTGTTYAAKNAVLEETDEEGDTTADWTTEDSEEKNTRSVRRIRGSRGGGWRSAIMQGNTIYLAYEGRLARMPAGGGADDVETLLEHDFTGENEILEMQVVGEWIYLRTAGFYNTDSLWRVRTDGTDLERITGILAADDDGKSTFAVMGDIVYLTCLEGEQLSASEVEFTSTLYRYQPDSGEAEEIYRTSSSKSSMNMVISSYTEKNLILLDSSDNMWHPTLLIYEYGADAPFVAPEATQELARETNCSFYDDMTGTGSYLANDEGVLYRISPENGYMPEKLPIRLFLQEEEMGEKYARDKDIGELLVLDGETFVYSYGISELGRGMRLYQNGILSDINGDKALQLDYPGDGYLYYAFPDQWSRYHHYRVRLDGTGWEQLDWEYGKIITSSFTTSG